MSLLNEYIRSRCSSSYSVSPSDFNEDVLKVLNELSLFEAVQTIHNFIKCLNSTVVDRKAFLIGIANATRRWWTNLANLYSAVDGAENHVSLENNAAFEGIFKISENVAKALFQQCAQNILDPEALSPFLVNAFSTSTVAQILYAIDRYNESENLHGSYFVRQEIFVSLINNGSPNVSQHGLSRAGKLSASITDMYSNTSDSSCVYLFVPHHEIVDTKALEINGKQVLETFKSKKKLPESDLKVKSWAELANNSKHKSRNETSNGNDSNDHSPRSRCNSVNSKQHSSGSKANSLNSSVLVYSDEEALAQLPGMLNNYILSKCVSNEHCRKSDFDGTARDALQRISFLQALQAIEHFATSVSSRIQKRPAYLMGILRGQESHWDKSRAAAQIEGGSVKLLALPPQVLLQIAMNCLEGNCLPSDFTPEVCLAVHMLSKELALKALDAFNSNKRIVAGCRGGILNRPRFFQRLIQNVAEQSHNPQSDKNVAEVPKSSRDRENSFASTGSSVDVNDNQKQKYGLQTTTSAPSASGVMIEPIKCMPGRAVSLSVSLDDENKSMSPMDNAWSSPLASSPVMGSTWANNVGNAKSATIHENELMGHASSQSQSQSQSQQQQRMQNHRILTPPITPLRSMSMDATPSPGFRWGIVDGGNGSNLQSPRRAFQNPLHHQPSIDNLLGSPHSSSPRSNEDTQSQRAPSPDSASKQQSSGVIDSPAQAIQRGWGSCSTSTSINVPSLQMPQSLGGPMIQGNWTTNHSSVNPHLSQQHYHEHRAPVQRSSSVGEYDLPGSLSQWNRNEYDVEHSDLNVAAKPFSMFSPTNQEPRANTPTSLASSPSPSPRNHSQQNQPQDEEPELNLHLDIKSRLSKLSSMRPEEKADILEKEVLKLNNDLQKVLSSERRAHNETRRLQLENAKIKTRFNETVAQIRQQIVISVSTAFDDAMLSPAHLDVVDGKEPSSNDVTGTVHQQQIQQRSQQQYHS